MKTRGENPIFIEKPIEYQWSILKVEYQSNRNRYATPLCKNEIEKKTVKCPK